MYLHLLYLHWNNIYSCKWILYKEKILQDVGLNYIWLKTLYSSKIGFLLSKKGLINWYMV